MAKPAKRFTFDTFFDNVSFDTDVATVSYTHLYYEDITDVRVTKKITGYYIFFMLVALLCCFAAPYTIILVPIFAWLGMNRIITISLRSGNQAVLYSGSKKVTEEFVTAVKNIAKIS